MERRESKKTLKEAADQQIWWREEKAEKLSMNQKIKKIDGGEKKQEKSQRCSRSTN